jgi:hypothetical protein
MIEVLLQAIENRLTVSDLAKNQGRVDVLMEGRVVRVPGRCVKVELTDDGGVEFDTMHMLGAKVRVVDHYTAPDGTKVLGKFVLIQLATE